MRVRFCLDASLSYKMAEIGRNIDWDVVHVSEVHELLSGEEQIGQCHAKDPDIAAWCVANGRILVAVDSDFKGGAQRTGVMRSAGVEMIWVRYDPKGLDEHLRATVARFEDWDRVLFGQARAPRVWLQKRRGDLQLEHGKKSKSRKNRRH